LDLINSRNNLYSKGTYYDQVFKNLPKSSQSCHDLYHLIDDEQS